MSTVVNVYAADCADFDNEGICPLLPSAWSHTEAANGKSVLALSHPYDAEGRHFELKRERILKADVPVRNVPEIQGGAYVATVEKWRVRATATNAQRTMYSRETKGRKMKCLPKGLEVYACKQGESRMKIRTAKYGTGWIATDGVESMVERVPYDSDRAIEAATPSEEVRSQLFRIVEVKRKLDGVEVTAEHIFYDLAGNLTDWKTQQSFTAQEMLDGIRSGCVDDCEFTFQTDIGDSRLSAEIRARNPVDALLNAEDGFIGRFGGEIIRDNYDITILRHAGMDRGLRVEFGRNLTGIEASWSADGVVTAIRPVGENKDGSALYLDGERVIDAPGTGDYAYRRIAELQVSEAKVDKSVSVALARARMREAVQAEFDRGVHLPDVNIKVEFARLGESEEYAAYRALEHCFLYDTVHASCENVCGDLELTVVSRTWDGMKRRFTKVELGVLGEDMSTGKLSATQIPSGISGLKIMPGTIGSGAIQAEAIAARHLQAESINAQALQAESVTAEKIAAESITTSKLAASSVTAEKLEAGSVDAHVVAAVAGKFGAIDAGNIETDALGAELARISRLVARTADIDWAHIKDLTTDTAIITQGVGGKLMISRLAVTEANMVSLTTGELVVKGADGSFYAVSVDENGEIVATRKQIGNDDVVDLSINAGEKLIEGSVTTACLNATEIFADSAVVRELIAANLDVDGLFAREAFIDRLATSSIVGGRSLTAIAGTADAAKSAADAAKSAADTAQSAAEAAQGTADGAMLATAHVGVKPPEAPIPAGRQWLDQGVEPWTLRSWIGADVRTEPEYAQTHSGNPVVLGEGRVLSLDSIRNSFGPVQAGSGDPYPAGGGKNLLPYFSAETKNGITLSVANDGTITLNGTPSADTAFVVNLASALPTGTYTMSLRSNAVNGYMAVWLENTDDWSTIGSVPNGALNNSKSFESTKAYHRAKLVVYTNAGTLSNLQLKIQLERGSAATEYAPYANIRPISGRTGVELTRCGKNLLKTNQLETQTIGGVTFTPVYTNGLLECVIANGTASAGGAIYWINDGLYFDGVFRVTGTPDVAGCAIGGAHVGAVDHNGYTHDWSGGATVTFALVVNPGITVNNAVFKPMVTRDMSATYADYAPYTGDDYAASFGQTVYGGTLDWMTGVLTADMGIKVFDGTESINTENGYYNFWAENVPQDAINVPGICSHYPYKKYYVPDEKQYGLNISYGIRFHVDMSVYPTADDFKSYLAAQYAAGTPVQVCYRLAEPIVVQLNLPAVYPLDGTNVLYGGTGALEVGSTVSGWRVVNDPAELQSAQEALALQQARMDEALNRLGMAMVLDADGVHVHRPVTNPPCETLTADDSFNVLVNSAIAATFAASYQKMGGQIVVRQTSNGLIFGG